MGPSQHSKARQHSMAQGYFLVFCAVVTLLAIFFVGPCWRPSPSVLGTLLPWCAAAAPRPRRSRLVLHRGSPWLPVAHGPSYIVVIMSHAPRNQTLPYAVNHYSRCRSGEGPACLRSVVRAAQRPTTKCALRARASTVPRTRERPPRPHFAQAPPRALTPPLFFSQPAACWSSGTAPTRRPRPTSPMRGRRCACAWSPATR